MGDVTETHAGGVVASGTPVACGSADAACVLGDGVLTRRELEDALYSRILPAARSTAPVGTIPTEAHAYYYVGHGVVYGRDLFTNAFAAEQARVLGALDGTSAPPARPAGEANWFVTDSKCRQKLWGVWSGGLYRGVEPSFTPGTDDIAIPFWAACTALVDGTAAQLAPSVHPILTLLGDQIPPV
jgi:hypothetical protein